jgi:hypothetical protein
VTKLSNCNTLANPTVRSFHWIVLGALLSFYGEKIDAVISIFHAMEEGLVGWKGMSIINRKSGARMLNLNSPDY